MPPLDRVRFVKLLERTRSDNDHEALSAIRMANDMLAKAGVGWTGLISGSRVKVDAAGQAPPWMRPAPRMTIPEAFDFLESRGELVDDYRTMYSLWGRRKNLSPRDQRMLFDRVYDLERLEKNSGQWEPE